MENKRFSSYVLFCSLGLMSCQPGTHPFNSESKIIHGRTETGFPYVVPIQMDGRYFCTGTFISDSVLLTAAHCVEHALSVEWLGTRLKSSRIYIHSSWPIAGDACQAQAADPQYDVALVQFPAGTYHYSAASFLKRGLQTGQMFTIVGYGNNRIIPFERYCTLPARKFEDGLCHVFLGVKGANSADYSYSSVLTFEPGNNVAGPGCPVDCSTSGLKSSLEDQELNLKDFVAQTCDGNFRDRSYQEDGVGTKRSGKNRISSLNRGTIRFNGIVDQDGTDEDSVSGSGDSGGPLFVEEDGRYLLAGVTHGGRLSNQNGSLHKVSVYADLTADASLDWIKAAVRDHQLNVPGFEN